jgi:phenylpyruvate tautomerase
MPLLSIQTNQTVPEERKAGLIAAASQLTANQLGKPESYVMVSMQDQCPMCFAGTTDPTAYLELKSIGLPASRTKELSAMLCSFVEEQLGIPADRVYIEFSDAARDMWGWAGGTFA